MSNLRITLFEVESILDSLLEHASHSWADMRRLGLIPDDADDSFSPPSVPSKYVGHAAYHLSAVIMYARKVYEALPDDVLNPPDKE